MEGRIYSFLVLCKFAVSPYFEAVDLFQYKLTNLVHLFCVTVHGSSKYDLYVVNQLIRAICESSLYPYLPIVSHDRTVSALWIIFSIMKYDVVVLYGVPNIWSELDVI